MIGKRRGFYVRASGREYSFIKLVRKVMSLMTRLELNGFEAVQDLLDRSNYYLSRYLSYLITIFRRNRDTLFQLIIMRRCNIEPAGW